MKNLFFAILSGLVLAIGWPTYGFPLFLFFGFSPLLLVEHSIREEKRSGLMVFAYSFFAFFIWNMITTWWIYNSTAFGMWFAEIANTLLMSLVFVIYHMVAKRTTFTNASLFLICLWLGFEYMHLQWEFSWPWLTLGNGFATYTSWIQWYEYTGTFGGSLWVWIVNISLFKGILRYKRYQETKVLKRIAIFNIAYIIIPILISLILLNTYTETGKKQEVLILQPNINPYTEKYNTTDARIGELITTLVQDTLSSSVDFIIAPETVYADNNKLSNFEYSIAKRTSRRLISNYPTTHIIAGISMYDRFTDPERVHEQTNQFGPNDFYDDYNSAFFVRPDGSSELYHKTKLVVGVENFPYQSVLKPILGDAMIDLGGTVAKKTTQENREVFFTRDSVGVGPIICYESVYGEFVTGYVRNKAGFLAIITNDAWWGATQGHQQHLAYARLRAIETRRSIARSANTGISALIDQTGTITQHLSYNTQGVIKGHLFTNDAITFYVRAGDYIARIAIFIAIFIFLITFTIRKKKL
ncbi:apolipoprotein N-acyltransferase [Aquimarina intermedia]|uniref:Apolipoprotein N-acyltransferase n=1 Tax=Aquimarina intermedia TaxID=350814 RepID=A0A5S5C0J5_9FLAO|nr:apolipoprotein N-acyltransferase [Aquimarina intermedia]TYP72941.1 apolipoprotein N-acyltransferase [Aquimarina intermedia]